MKTGIELIAEERQEQIEKHGFDIKIDAEYYQGDELKQAALYCLTFDEKYYPPTWSYWFKEKIENKQQRMSPIDFQIEMQKIAGALLAASIDFIISTSDK